MPAYFLAYDLINERKNTSAYQPLWDELERLGAQRTQYSLWLLNVTDGPKDVANHFKKFIDSDDSIWVTRLRKGEYHFINARSGTNAWLGKNEPT